MLIKFYWDLQHLRHMMNLHVAIFILSFHESTLQSVYSILTLLLLFYHTLLMGISFIGWFITGIFNLLLLFYHILHIVISIIDWFIAGLLNLLLLFVITILR